MMLKEKEEENIQSLIAFYRCMTGSTNEMYKF